MAKSFEDTEVWQTARQLVQFVYRISRNGAFQRDYGLREQIRRAAVSSLANIAEGLERGSNTELIQFLFIAKGSAGEVRSHLYVASDQGYLVGEEFQTGAELCLLLSRKLSNLIRYLKASGFKGRKHKIDGS